MRTCLVSLLALALFSSCARSPWQERVLDPAAASAERELIANGWSPVDARAASTRLRSLDFSSAMIVAANRSLAPPAGKPLLALGADEAQPGDSLTLQTALETMIKERRPQQAIGDDALLARAIQAGAKARDIEMTDEQAAAVLDLVESGRFARDVGAAVQVAAVDNGLHLSRTLGRSRWESVDEPLFLAIKRDYVRAQQYSTDEDLRERIASWRDGEVKAPARLLKDTLTHIHAQASPEEVRDMIIDLLEHDVVQLAVIVYAQANGLPCARPDVAAVRQHLVDDGDLGPLLARGCQRLKDTRGGDAPKAMKFLDSLSR